VYGCPRLLEGDPNRQVAGTKSGEDAGRPSDIQIATNNVQIDY
jgi:hypothetical protein